MTSAEEGVSTLRVGADDILYRSASMRSVMATVNLIAQSDECPAARREQPERK
jgi:hypothetical protein